MRRIGRWLSAALAIVGWIGPANAAWQRASSAHFVIYANESPAQLLAFATKLEKFDKAVRHIRRMDDPPFGDGNRLTVYVVPSVKVVQQLLGDKSGSTYGFYSGRATGSLAIVPYDTGAETSNDLTADTVFFHEYAHHLMLSLLDAAYPEWLIEGFAEFMATARFEKDSSVGLGAAPQFRAYGLFEGDSMPLDRLLRSDFGHLSAAERESAYGRSWLLTHYLNFNAERAPQMATYLAELEKGGDSVAAARKAFGDLRQLDRELAKYLNQPRLSYTRIFGSVLQTGPIEVRPLSPGAAAVINDRIRSKVGVDSKTAEPLAVRVRAVARHYPDDLLVERTLAEAELDSGHADAALAAADRALGIDPRDVEAMLFKGLALMAGSRPDRFVEARKLFSAANRIDTEDPRPLMYFYQSVVRQGVPPAQTRSPASTTRPCWRRRIWGSDSRRRDIISSTRT